MKTPPTDAPCATAAAIIGIGCLFPKSQGLKAFWKLLLHGRDAITDVPESHWSAEDYYDPDPKKPDHVYCRRGGFLPTVAFDPSRFGIPPNTLEATDTSQLLALEAAWAALSDAGYGESADFDRSRTAVILGVTGTQELVIPLGARLGHPIWRRALKKAGIPGEKAEAIVSDIAASYVSWQESSFPGLLGNVVAGRVANRLNLGGTNCVVDAACASSLAAVHHALGELQAGQADMVVTGGVDTLNDIFMHMCFSKSHILSPTGDVRPFSKDADGTLLGEGVGLLVMKRLEDARRDGDRIYAVLRGIGTSSDGRSQSIYAPNPDGQARALRRAYEAAGVSPSTIGMVEAHGTGTRVGDEVEFKALKAVYTAPEAGARRTACAIGSVKSMIGHTKAAAGAAGIIKASLALYHKTLLPTLKADTPDPKLAVEDSPFYIASRIRPWFSRADHPRRSAVSAFGFGGSNFHAVLEEHEPQKRETAWDGSVQILAFSGEAFAELEARVADLKKEIEDGIPFERLAAFAADTRSRFRPDGPFRLALVLDLSGGDPRAALPALEETLTNLAEKANKAFWKSGSAVFGTGPLTGRLAFLFPGQGSQYVEMGRDLTLMFPEAFAAMEAMNAAFDGDGLLSDAIFPLPAAQGEDPKNREAHLRGTNLAQPAIGAVSLGMLRILERFKLRPDATAGHSYGELPALLTAGCMDEDAFCRLSVARGRCMAEAGNAGGDPGAMMAVKAPIERIKELVKALDSDVVLANLNSPDQGVLSGSTAGIDAAEKALKERKMKGIRLQVAAAFHSHLVASAQKPFEAMLEKETFRSGGLPVMSNTTGGPYPKEAEAARRVLAFQLTHSVDFIGNVEALYGLGVRSFVEVGPKSVLTGLVKAILSGRDFHAISLDASGGKKSGLADLALALSHLAVLGHAVDLTGWEPPASPAAPDKPRMAVPICGANYRSQASPGNPGPKAASKNEKPASERALEPSGPALRKERSSEPTVITLKRNPNHAMSPHPKITVTPCQNLSPVPAPDSDAPFGRAAAQTPGVLRVVEAGLESIQMLQLQTAEAHKKFLDTQAEAAKALQMMMESSRKMAEAIYGTAVESPFKEQSAPLMVAAPAPEVQRFESPAVAKVPFPTVPEPVSGPPAAWRSETEKAATQEEPARTPAPFSETPSVPDDGKESDLPRVLLQVVSELTGYPDTMLDLDMDLEADLGIDSIKRVEILSTLEERMPHLPQVPPETLGTLKSLRQILSALAGADVRMTLPQNPTAEADFLEKNTGNIASPAADDGKTPAIAPVLLQVVSELTGYPDAMLDLDMDLEADLGIDSIKRVEILSTLEERMPALPPVGPEQMGTLKTLRQILACLSSGAGLAASGNPAQAGCPQPVEMPVPGKGEMASMASISHQPVVEPAPLQAVRVLTREAAFSSGRTFPGPILITKDDAGMSAALQKAIQARGKQAMILDPGHAESVGAMDAVGGLVLVAPLSPEAAFGLVQAAGPHYTEALSKGHKPVFFSVTRMDGAFGFSGRTLADPMSGALPGLVKTAALEWKGLFGRAIDVDAEETDVSAIAGRIADELLLTDPSGALEVGFSKGNRQELDLFPFSYDALPDPGSIDGVWVVSGGGRGVTAACVKVLSEKSDAFFVLLGRSPVPAPEPAWLQGIDDPARMKAAILSHLFKGETPTPAELEAVYREIAAGREIAATLDAMNRERPAAIYLQVDVKDPEAVADVLQMVRSRHGAITGIIHGAGVLEDRLIGDKRIDQFRQVFDTKTTGMRNLLAATENDPLTHVVFFSSVAGRTGNPGQSDYAMANEVLNKTAWQLRHTRPGVRTLSINWGPWDGGMVTPSLRRMFEARGATPIALDEGAAAFVRLVCAMDAALPAELVAGRGLQPETRVTADSSLSLSFKRELNTDRFPILSDHAPDGIPRVPLSLITEWLGHGAIHGNPGLQLVGLDDFRLVEAIRVEGKGKMIRLMAGRARKQQDFFEVDLEVRNGMRGGMEVVHSKARALLAAEPFPPPPFKGHPLLDRTTGPMGAEVLYGRPPFSGVGLKGIRRVIGMDETGAAAQIATAPSPDNWMKEPLRNHWIADPLAVEAAFQLMSLWGFETRGQTFTATSARSYRQYCRRYPREHLVALLEVREQTPARILGDIVLLGPDRSVVAQILGCEASASDPSTITGHRGG